MDARELETTLLRLSHDTEATEINSEFKGFLILSVNGTKVFASPKTIVRAAKNSGQPSTHSGLTFMVTDEDGTPLMNYRAISNEREMGKPVGIRDATFDEFVDKYGSLFEYNELDFSTLDDPFKGLMDRIP